MRNSSLHTWLVALFLGIASLGSAATPTVEFTGLAPTEPRLISSGGIDTRAVARGTEADPVTRVVVTVTQVNSNAVLNSSGVSNRSERILLHSHRFTPPKIGPYQITATAFTLSGGSNSSVSTLLVTNVARGERPYTQGIYHSAHNAYSRAELLNEQVDDYNVWQIELDVAWDNGGPVVDHDCITLPTARPLSEELDELNNSADFTQRFTAVYLELKDPNSSEQSCREAWPALDTYRTAILNTFSNYFDMTRLYTPEEFVGTDGRYWPSIQELKRRGKNFAIIANEIVTSGYQQYHPVLFSETIQNDGDYANNQVQVSLPGSSDPYPGASSTPPIYLWRVYPAGNLATDTTWDGHWDKYVSRGFNFVANNVLDDGDRVTDVRTQAPEPTYLDLNTSASRNWGTRAYPFRAFDAAYWRASPMTTIKLKPATYTLFFTNVLSKSVVLKKDGTEASNPIITKP